ncbi:hypothetical protein [Mycobacterium sp. Root265]|uniref:hypothetical protein n=1 Tax=Mycobacterium sp. Root265 TaxID=1736504 RepID=UPI000A593640|nr:hypothetical protein [Mycobacterium sp. Root265]
MDPDEALQMLLALATSDLKEFGDEVHEMANLALALDGWLRNGGFLPKAWQR